LIVVVAVARRAIVVDVVVVVAADACRTVAIVVDNGKTPEHRRRQRCHRNEGNSAIATTAKTPAH
jgi:hypothetical protein